MERTDTHTHTHTHTHKTTSVTLAAHARRGLTSARGHELSGRVRAQAYNYYAWRNALGSQSKLLITPLSD